VACRNVHTHPVHFVSSLTTEALGLIKSIVTRPPPREAPLVGKPVSGRERSTDDPGVQDGLGARPPVTKEVALSADVGVPANLVFIAILVGLLLASGGAAMMILVRDLPNVGGLTACIGFEIVLAAFGARAAGAWGDWSIAGSGAMAVVLFMLMMRFAPPPPKETPFVYGYIRGTSAMPGVTVTAQDNFLTGQRSTESDWQFFARQDWLTGDIFSITFLQTNGGKTFKNVIGCIPIDVLKHKVGSQDGADLTLTSDVPDPTRQQWSLRQTNATRMTHWDHLVARYVANQGRHPNFLRSFL
jgi:hypothetical protein